MATRRQSRRRKRTRRLAALAGFTAAVVVAGMGGVALSAALTAGRNVPAGGLPTQTPAATERPTPQAPSPSPTPTAPVSPASVGCATTVDMSVWAHYDDDLLFLNPTLSDAIRNGHCVRTVFLTASDAGRGGVYASARELGILRAYNTMRGEEGLWTENKVTLLTGLAVSLWSPEGDPDITVTFVRLPDGNLNGGGFPSTGYVSLPQLLDGSLAELAPVGGGPGTTLDTLVRSIAELIDAYHPERLFTAVPRESAEWSAEDHPDHASTGSITRLAWQRAGFAPDQVSYAIGYPTLSLSANVIGEPLTRKVETFRVYAAQDPVVACPTDDACLTIPKFGGWLQRSYLKTENELFPQ